MEDLTIAVFRGLEWASLRPYAVSLARTGFKGTKLALVENISDETRQQFTRLGFTIMDRVTPAPHPFHPQMSEGWAYGIARFLPAVEYLKQNPNRFRYVIWTDVRDVIFQSDPSVWLEKNLAPSVAVVAGLGHKIRRCPWNDPWVQGASPRDYARVREMEAVACGTFAGTANVMRNLMEDIYKGCLAANHPQATDQGMLNVLIRTAPYESIVRVPKLQEAFSAQWYPAKDGDPTLLPNYAPPIFDKVSQTVYAPDSGIPFSIVHLYDRDRTWLALFREKYR